MKYLNTRVTWSSRRYRDRLENLQKKLQLIFDPRHEQEVSQDIVLSILGLLKDDKSLATRAVKGAFPCCKLGKKGHLDMYKNTQRKKPFTCTEEINQVCEGTNK